MRYESAWDYEEYVRIAVPAYHALVALLRRSEMPCVLFAHEFMGLPTAFKAIMDGESQFRTIFHAHECATARRLVENHVGHDTRFYNLLERAQNDGQFVEDVFGDQSDSFRHALISKAHLCDGIIAVGDYTAREMHFLGEHFDHHLIDMVYNGVPASDVSMDQKSASRDMLCDYSETLLGFRPDVLMTHVTRPVISKGLWRDGLVCEALDEKFGREGITGVLYILTSAGGTRRPQDIRSMESEYGWPRQHRAGYPDLVGPELDINLMVETFNARHRNIQLVLVNQFGWNHQRIGQRLPRDMDIADLRRATDIEFGMATYEPFGISPLEPLGSGALCVISNVCGCKGFVDFVTDGHGIDNVIVADFTTLDHDITYMDLLHLSHGARDYIEHRECASIADVIMQRLPLNHSDRQQLLASGQAIVDKLGWDAVLQNKMLPMLQRVISAGENGTGNGSAAPVLASIVA